MYIARPFALNHSRQQSFDTILGAAEYLANETGYDLGVEDWIALGKILEMDIEGNTIIPTSFTVVKKQQLVQKTFDINSLL